MITFKVIIKGLKWNSISSVVKVFIQLIQISLLTNYLSKEELGLFSISLFFIQFSTIFGEMGSMAALYSNNKIDNKVFSSLFWYNIFLSLFIILILLLTSNYISIFYDNLLLRKIIPLLALNILFLSIGRLSKIVLFLNFEFKKVNYIEVISTIISFIVLLILLKLDFGIYSLIYSLLINSLISNILYLILSKKYMTIFFYYNYSEVKALLKVGSYNAGSSFLDFFSKELDIIIVGKFFSIEALGMYSISKQIAVKLHSFITPIISNVLNPLFSKIKDDIDILKNTYINLMSSFNFFITIIFGIVIINSEEILLLFTNSNFIQNKDIFTLFLFNYFIISILSSVGNLQIATGRTDIGLYWTIFRLLTTIPVLFIGTLFSIKTLVFLLVLLSLFYIYFIWKYQISKMISINFSNFLKIFKLNLIFIIGIIIVKYFFESYYHLHSAFIGMLFKSLFFLVIFTVYQILFNKAKLLDIKKII